MSGMYIPNMEEPRTCCQCKMSLYNPEIKWCDAGKNAVGGWVCLLTGELIDNARREEHCPVIFVPDHGRLGDLDALFRRGEYQRDHHYHLDGIAARQHRAEFNHFLIMISNAPTVISEDKGASE